jgi:hypothetical protein
MGSAPFHEVPCAAADAFHHLVRIKIDYAFGLIPIRSLFDSGRPAKIDTFA